MLYSLTIRFKIGFSEFKSYPISELNDFVQSQEFEEMGKDKEQFLTHLNNLIQSVNKTTANAANAICTTIARKVF